jgi:hypothetical protein
MPQTPPPDDDFPQKPPAQRFTYVIVGAVSGRYHIVVSPFSQAWRQARPLCGFVPVRGWAQHWSAPINPDRVCPRCLEVRRRGAQRIPPSPELAAGAEADVERAS